MENSNFLIIESKLKKRLKKRQREKKLKIHYKKQKDISDNERKQFYKKVTEEECANIDRIEKEKRVFIIYLFIW